MNINLKLIDSSIIYKTVDRAIDWIKRNSEFGGTLSELWKCWWDMCMLMQCKDIYINVDFLPKVHDVMT